ncbi:MAG: MexE family multidrug efflux transporter periplasmic adaptor subunit [Proteobacteria bacterium]|nr:MexE family multidrug efflux transporter periplasmic adaptor subunit [Pseudomonadota bacterium]
MAKMMIQNLPGQKLLLLGVLLAAACSPHGQDQAAPPVEVTTATIAPRDVPIALQYVGQTESSRLVEIRARVDGYLQKKYYSEGMLVRQNDPLFLIDPRPLKSQADSTAAALQDKENWAQNARKTQERLQPLLAENAISKKDFDDAVAAEKSAAAALAASKAEHARAGMNLSYTRITSPLTGIAGRSNLAEGTYINPATNGLLTTVAQVDPIWVNFSISENEWLRYSAEAERGTLRFPKDFQFEVEMILSDGRTLPNRGKVDFASPSVDSQTGTYAVRATFPNKDMAINPGQFVRVRLNGVIRPAALLVPQSAVMQGQTGKFVYVVSPESKAEIRPVEVGDWHGDDWFVTSGLKGNEQVIVGGVVKVQPGAPLKIVSQAANTPAKTPAPAAPEAKK